MMQHDLQFPNRVTITIRYFLRQRRNDPWERCNLPRKIHKWRRILISLTGPKTAETIRVTVKTAPLSSSTRNNCCVRLYEKDSPEDKVCLYFNSKDKKEEKEIFLAPKHKKNMKQKVIIEATCASLTLSKTWEIETIESHNYESRESKKLNKRQPAARKPFFVPPPGIVCKHSPRRIVPSSPLFKNITNISRPAGLTAPPLVKNILKISHPQVSIAPLRTSNTQNGEEVMIIQPPSVSSPVPCQVGFSEQLQGLCEFLEVEDAESMPKKLDSLADVEFFLELISRIGPLLQEPEPGMLENVTRD